MVIAIETNILVYAHRSDSPFYEGARAALREVAEGSRRWVIPWPCAHEFIGVVTNHRAFATPSTFQQAFNQIESWASSAAHQWISTTPEHWLTLSTLCRNAKVTGGMIYDARIAAICIENGVSELWTADRDFSRFAGLKTRNPLF